VLDILWLEGRVRNTHDLIPDALFARDRTISGSHRIRLRNGRTCEALCTVTTKGTVVEIDYGGKHAEANYANCDLAFGPKLKVAILRLTFTDALRKELEKVEWDGCDCTDKVTWWFGERDTQAQALIMARRGQAAFKKNIQQYESQCRLTGITNVDFLIASHILPWAEATPEERLDGANGLMLAPHADRLFDRHFISFEDDGTVLKSKALPDEVWRALGFENVTNVGKFNPRQAEYMKLHRKAFYEKQ
jgi:hypothetical protein